MINKVTQVSILATSVLFALALAPNEAAAKPRAKGAYGKPWRLHFESEFFGVTHYNPDGGDDDPEEKQTNIGFGIARPSTLDDHGALVGGNLFGRPLIGVGFGYAFSEERAILGAKLALTVDGIDTGDSTHETLVGGRFIPYFQWMFLPGSWVRPYVEVRLGLGGTARTFRDEMDPEEQRFTQHFIYPLVGFGGGVHLFPVDYFSIDLGLNFDYVAPHGRLALRDPPDGFDDNWDKLGDLINFGVLVGASVWF